MERRAMFGVVAMLTTLGVGMLFGCGGAGNIGDSNTSGGTVRSGNGVVEITLPDGWSEQSDLNDEADLQVANLGEEAYLIVLTEPKSDFDDGTTIDVHSGLTRPNITNGLTNGSTSEPKRIQVDGRDAVQYEIRGNMSGLDVVYYHTTVDGQNHFHQILSWTLASHEDQNRAVLDQVLKSFKETGN